MIGPSTTSNDTCLRNHPFAGLWRRALTGGILLALASGTALADQGRGRHRQLYVVPAPGPVTIDGRLDEWDLSGQIEMFVLEATRSTQSAKFAVMHDDQALYIGGEVRDPSPMMNRHDPKVRPHRAWDADACQFRLLINPEAEYPVLESAFAYRGPNAAPDTRDDIVHLLMWHFTDDGSANLQMHYGMGYRTPREEWGRHGLVPYDLFDAAYRQWDDGRGYTFEYRIPWATLGAKRPLRGGDAVAGTVQVMWSRPDGLSTGGGRSWAYDIMRQPGFPFQSAACWGRLIFTEQGNIPQELVLEGVPRERPLPLEFAYELPDNGEATIQLVDEAGWIRRILVAQQDRLGGLNVERWDGMDNHGEAPGHGAAIPAGDYRWQGTINSQRLRAEYRFSVHNSGQPPYFTGDGKGGWGGDHGTPQDVAALADGMLICWSGAEHGCAIVKVDLDGRKQWGSSGRQMHPYFMASDGQRVYYSSGATVEMIAVADARPTTLPSGATTIEPPPGGDPETSRISGLAYGDGRLYVAYGRRNLIGVYDTQNASLLETWPLPAPGRLVPAADGRLLAISAGAIVERQPADGQWRTLIDAAQVDDPAGLARDADGTLYVANRGRRQTIGVFAADGTLRRSIGREGGRPAMGRYEPSGLYMAGGIALDARGRLWAAETTDAPKRVSVWEVDTGQNVAEYFGAASYFAYGHIDPARPDEIYAHNVLWEIDWKKYAAKPKTTIWRQTEPNMAPAPTVDAHGGGFRLTTASNGHQFGFGGTPHRRVMVYRRDGDLFRPFVGHVNPWADSYPALAELKDQLDRQWEAARVPNHQRPRELFWQDANDDGLVDAGEVAALGKEVGTILWLDQELTLWLSCGRRLKPRQIAADGRPLYDLAEAEETPLRGSLAGVGWTTFDDQGAAYTVNVTQSGTPGPGLTRWRPTGEVAWRHPDILRWRDAISLPSAGPGRLWSMTKPMGVAGDFLATQTYMGVNHLFRTDGMYVGAVLGGGPSGGLESRDDSRYDSQPEGQGGSFVKLNLAGKERYFIIHGGHGVKVWEVLGLDSLRDLPGGIYAHTPESVATAETAYASYRAGLAGGRAATLVRGREALAEAPPVGRRVEGDRGFKARLAYDDDHLYLHVEVEAPHGLVNSQADPQVVFRGGNLIDLQLATDPNADPERKTPAPGDLRLLVTRQEGKPFAVLYRPRVAGFEGDRIVLTSPTGKEPFDRIEVVDDVALDYAETDLGFAATVAVPLKTLGLKPVPGQELRFDLGYIFGNAHGNRTQRRAYLNNNSFSANVVDDIPNESRLEPAEWGTATVR